MTDGTYLSTKMIDRHDRLIVALDVESSDAAKAMVLALGDAVSFYKMGLQLFMAGDYFDLLAWLVAQNKKVFVDLKFFDVPATVGAAVRQLQDKGATFVTVHGNDAMLKAAVATAGDVQILAVTVLTSLDRGDLDALGFECDVKQLVLSRAQRAIMLGCAGVISSGLEAPELRDNLGDNFLIVAPGIRPVANVDDQKRTVDVEQAFLNGADYIVVGRPIRQAADPRQAALDIQNRIQAVFAADHKA